MRKKSNSRSYFLKFRSQAEFAPWQARFSILPLFYICLAKALPRQKTPGQRLARCKRRKAFSPAHAGVGVRSWFLLGRFYLPTLAGGLSAAPRSPVLLRRIFARRDKKRRSIKKAERRHLFCEGRKAFPSRRRGRSVVVFAWAILSTRSRRRGVRRSPVAGAAPPHFRPARAKSGSLR